MYGCGHGYGMDAQACPLRKSMTSDFKSALAQLSASHDDAVSGLKAQIALLRDRLEAVSWPMGLTFTSQAPPEDSAQQPGPIENILRS